MEPTSTAPFSKEELLDWFTYLHSFLYLVPDLKKNYPVEFSALNSTKDPFTFYKIFIKIFHKNGVFREAHCNSGFLTDFSDFAFYYTKSFNQPANDNLQITCILAHELSCHLSELSSDPVLHLFTSNKKLTFKQAQLLNETLNAG